MNILFDTTVLIDLEREKEDTLLLLEKLTNERSLLLISTISVSEFLAGVYQREDYKNKLGIAREFLEQFNWIDLNEVVAEETAKLLAYCLVTNRERKYQDIAIAATFLNSGADFLITDNLKDFDFLELKGKIYSAKEFLRALREKKLKFVK